MANIAINSKRGFPLNKPITLNNNNMHKNYIIYNWTVSTELEATYPQLFIVNRVTGSHHHTTARYKSVSGEFKRLTSDAITKVIGQKNYKQVLLHLQSTKEYKKRVELILCLLTEERNRTDATCQTDKVQYQAKPDQKRFVSHPIHMERPKPRKLHAPSNKIQGPYVVKKRKINEDTVQTVEQTTKQCQDLEQTHYTNPLSVESEILEEAEITVLQAPPKKVTCASETNVLDEVSSNGDFPKIRIFDGTEISVPFKPTDIFHITAPEVMKWLTHDEQRKLLIHQGYIDWKYCLERDTDGLLLIHLAVLNDDFDLLKRQCVVLKARGESIDIPASNGMTPLQMALSTPQRSSFAQFLISRRAELVSARGGGGGRAALLDVAAAAPRVAAAALHALVVNARTILQNNEDLGYPGMEDSPDQELATHLLLKIGHLFDRQGYNPLMIASSLGNYEVAELFLQYSPHMINVQTPNFGKTALYLAVEGAARAIQGKVSEEKYLKTIEILIAYNTDPTLTNNNGVAVTELLMDLKIQSLNEFFAKEMSKRNSPNGEIGILSLNNGIITHEHLKPANMKRAKRTVETERQSKPTGYNKYVHLNRQELGSKTINTAGTTISLERQALGETINKRNTEGTVNVERNTDTPMPRLNVETEVIPSEANNAKAVKQNKVLILDDKYIKKSDVLQIIKKKDMLKIIKNTSQAPKLTTDKPQSPPKVIILNNKTIRKTIVIQKNTKHPNVVPQTNKPELRSKVSVLANAVAPKITLNMDSLVVSKSADNQDPVRETPKRDCSLELKVLESPKYKPNSPSNTIQQNQETRPEIPINEAGGSESAKETESQQEFLKFISIQKYPNTKTIKKHKQQEIPKLSTKNDLESETAKNYDGPLKKKHKEKEDSQELATMFVLGQTEQLASEGETAPQMVNVKQEESAPEISPVKEEPIFPLNDTLQKSLLDHKINHSNVVITKLTEKAVKHVTLSMGDRQFLFP